MPNTILSVSTEYAAGYAKGRHAAKEHIAETDNPFRATTPAFRGWNDGYFDEVRARRVAVERGSAFAASSFGRN